MMIDDAYVYLQNAIQLLHAVTFTRAANEQKATSRAVGSGAHILVESSELLIIYTRDVVIRCCNSMFDNNLRHDLSALSTTRNNNIQAA